MKKYNSESYNYSSELDAIKIWLSQDVKDAKFELQSYIKMKDKEMIDYWRQVVEYLNNFISHPTNNKIEMMRKDLILGNDAEQYAANKILVRLGIK